MNKKLDSSEGTKLAELNNALFEAAEKSSLSKVKALVEKGADVNSKHGRFELPVLLNALTVWRLSKSRIEIIQWLINNGADVNLQDNAERTPLQEACSHDRLDIAQLLIKKGAAIAQSDGSTLLHHAVNGKNNSNEELWDFLLGLDIDINCQRRDNKRTALHYAVYIQNLKATKFLIEKGADINLRDHERKTPFEIACECKMEKIIAVFEKRGLGQRKTLVKKA